MSPDFPFLDWKPGEARFSPHKCPLPVVCLRGLSSLVLSSALSQHCPPAVSLLSLASVPPQEHDLPQTMYRNGSFLSVPFTVSFKGVSSAGICCWNEQSGAVESLLCAKFCAGHCPCLPKVLVSWGRHFFFLFGCARFSLWHVGFSGCGSWAGLPCGMWDLSSLTRGQTLVPCIGKQILNHWTTREVPGKTLLNTQNHNDHNEGALRRGTGSCLRPGLFQSAHIVQSSGCHTGPGTRWAPSNMH